jgi:ribosome biogenesis GTPase A
MASQNTRRESVLDSFQAARERILGLCREEQFPKCLANALSENILEDLEVAVNRLQQNDIYVGALGVQGVGKSTLLNALLFGRRILPWDVTETTAVLTKVYRSDNSDERAEVVFRDNKSKDITLDPDSLREYVHNEFNPGNQKKVKELKCFVNSPLLSQGICLVDTPGVASLTEEIGRVTLEFLPALSASIFITLTTPCLTKT